MKADRIPLFGPGLKRLTALNLDVERIVRHAGISPSLLHQAKVSLTTREYFALWAAIERVSKDPLIGLRIGGEATSDQFDPASFAALHSRTVREALERLARYKRLSCPEIIRLETVGNTTRVSIHWVCAKGLAPVALTDAAFANIHLLLRCGSGKVLAPLRMERTQQLEDVPRYAEHFGCEVLAGEGQDALVYENMILDEPFLTGNVDLIEALLPGLDMQLAAASPLPLDVKVKAVLAQMMRGEHPSIETVARRLYLSPRTMQRRLAEANTSYQAILDAVRIDAACNLLDQTSLEPGEIAFYLGFEEINSFQRAFRRWLGMTPTQWRNREHTARS